MQRSAALYGILGLVLLAFAGIDALVSAGGFRVFSLVNFAAGIFALILYITSGWSTIGSA